MPGAKSMDKIPDFEMEDISSTFARWLQRRCREMPRFEEKVAKWTGATTATVRKWRHGQPAGVEAMLKATACCGGPRAFNEVFLEPLGMTGARYVDEDGNEVVEHAFAARREMTAIEHDLSRHPSRETCEAALDQVLHLVEDGARVARKLSKLCQDSTGAQVVDLPERGKRA